MKLLIFLACSVFAVNAVSFFDLVLEEWQYFKIRHNKTYTSEIEEKFRMKIFMENKHKIAKHNSEYEKGAVSFKMGLNGFADMLHSEFVQTKNGFNRTARNLRRKDKSLGSTYIPPANVQFPDEVNWVKKGAVTPVKDQGPCGSCWAFSSTGALEGQHFRKSGVLISLSEQNLIDCSKTGGNNGCHGGDMDVAFTYIKENKGIDTEKSYPYLAVEGSCKYNPSNSGATDTGFVDLPLGDEDQLLAAVATIGPISVGIDASRESFTYYSGGIYSDPKCSNSSLDHGVLVVGYGTDKDTGKDYWLVKNSWDVTWGEEGYFRLARNEGNMCGIATAASYPLV